MVVCQYYLRGACRFGEKCKYEHPRGNSNQGYQNQGGYGDRNDGRKSVQFHDSFGGSPQYGQSGGGESLHANAQLDAALTAPASEIISNLGTEINGWEKSHMWQFSCVTYWKDGACIPGFDDISPEELRFDAYEAQKSNRLAEYTARVVELLTTIRQNRQELIHPSMATKQKLMSFIEDEKIRLKSRPDDNKVFGSSQSNSSLFGTSSQSAGGFGSSNQSASSIFGSASQPGTGFGGATGSQSGSGFGSGSQSAASIFASVPSQSGSVFGGSTQSQTSTFGAASSAFGGSAPTAFGAAPSFTSPAFTNATTPTVFGAAPSQPTPGSVFGGTPTFGGSPTAASPFGAPPVQAQTTTGSVFGGASTVGSTPSPSSVFGNAASSTPQAGSVFGGGLTFGGTPAPSTGGSTFGGTPAPSTGFGTPASSNINQTLASSSTPQTTPSTSQTLAQLSLPAGGAIKFGTYMTLSLLTPEERAEFEAPRFTLGRIPTRPPPKELC